MNEISGQNGTCTKASGADRRRHRGTRAQSVKISRGFSVTTGIWSVGADQRHGQRSNDIFINQVQPAGDPDVIHLS